MKMPPRCPIELGAQMRCLREVKVHSATDTEITYTCPKHGQMLRAVGLSLTTRELLCPPAPPPPQKSPYPKLPSVEELQNLANVGSYIAIRTLTQYRMKIVKRFLGEFVEARLYAATTHVLKKRVFEAWDEWFAGHYYCKWVTKRDLGLALRRKFQVDLRTDKYFLFLAIKEKPCPS